MINNWQIIEPIWICKANWKSIIWDENKKKEKVYGDLTAEEKHTKDRFQIKAKVSGSENDTRLTKLDNIQWYSLPVEYTTRYTYKDNN